jgi:hypothetical protein
MSEDIVDILINKYVKENFTVCFYCKKARRVTTNGFVECAEFGVVRTALTCQRYEATEWAKKAFERGYTRALEKVFGGKNE